VINYPSPENPPNVSRASEPMGSLFTGCTRTNCTKNVGVHVTRTRHVLRSTIDRRCDMFTLTATANSPPTHARRQQHNHRCTTSTCLSALTSLRSTNDHRDSGATERPPGTLQSRVRATGSKQNFAKNLGRHNYRMVKGTGSKFENLLKEEGRISSYATDQH